ncbi:MAG: lipoprotein signal peptidase [Dysgonamonadaceae bacterium]|jgi:signal peptidase II|nr:lipoprotein signal peptidase [Dysgonamonadaceae bacterium]
MKLPKGFWAIAVVLLVLIADQALKIWVKTNMYLGQSFEITSWFKIYFTENNGMAFGIEVIGKLFLSIFRIIASCVLIYYLYQIVKRKLSTGYIVCIALIFAGAVGNIIDCIFYGVIFDSSYGQVATLFPPGGGYSTWLHGKVVDMFYFPIIDTTWPKWVPFWGGNDFVFFSPIFNLADSAISVGVAILFLFYRKTLAKELESPKKDA